MDRFEKLPLHDATFDFINIKWEDYIVEIKLFAFVKNNENALPYTLKFAEVSEMYFPHKNPWGESKYINNVYVKNGMYHIEIQSGDIIKTKSKDFSFEPINL